MTVSLCWPFASDTKLKLPESLRVSALNVKLKFVGFRYNLSLNWFSASLLSLSAILLSPYFHVAAMTPAVGAHDGSSTVSPTFLWTTPEQLEASTSETRRQTTEWVSTDAADGCACNVAVISSSRVHRFVYLEITVLIFMQNKRANSFEIIYCKNDYLRFRRVDHERLYSQVI